jgi:hypothetical protein
MQSNQSLIPIRAHLQPFRLAQDSDNLLKVAKSMHSNKERTKSKHHGAKQ